MGFGKLGYGIWESWLTGFEYIAGDEDWLMDLRDLGLEYWKNEDWSCEIFFFGYWKRIWKF